MCQNCVLNLKTRQKVFPIKCGLQKTLYFVIWIFFFNDIFNGVLIDEKLFYRVEEELLPRWITPSSKIKKIYSRVTFLAAKATPKFDTSEKISFDWKFGICLFTQISKVLILLYIFKNIEIKSSKCAGFYFLVLKFLFNIFF